MIGKISTLLFCCAQFVAFSVLAQDASSSAAQNLTLFEEVETTSTANNSPGRPTRESRATISEPEFTLVGTSRIGGEYSAMLRHKGGEVLTVKASPSGSSAIQAHPDYAVVDIRAGTISVRYPGNNPCVEFNELGVRCNDAGNIAELVLANGEPLPTVRSSGEESSIEDDPDSLNLDTTNPFEALRNAQNGRVARGQIENQAGGRFVPRRISPEDVPEGMRIVSTPFGDRVVEE